MSICSNSLVALRALEADRTMSPLVHQCQKALNEISSRHAVGLFWVPGHAEYEAMKSPMDSRGMALPRGSMDLSRPWVSPGKIFKKGSVAAWSTSTGLNGKVLVIPNDRLESLSRDLVWVPGQNS